MPPVTKWIGSTNKTPGRGGYRPEAIVIHIMEGTLAGTDSWFNTSKAMGNKNPTSAHYGVGKSGVIHQYVHEMDTAWHAGRVYRAAWPLIRPRVSPNLYTIGIEHEGYRDSTWSDAMYEASAALIADIARRWSIPLDRDHVIGHCDIYAHKSFCPGNASFDRLIARAREVTLGAGTGNFVPAPGRATTRTTLNVRRGAPTAQAPLARAVPANTTLDYAGWTSAGQSVHGNTHWYRDRDGNYFWAGGTDRPLPGAG